VTSVTGAGTYTFGTEKQISCAVASGYRFLAWTENNAQGEVISNSNPFTLVVNRDITLYPLTEATASDIYRIYFHIINPGWGNICRGSEIYHVTYNDGDSYEDMIGEENDFWPEPASGYEFVKWQMNGDDYSTNERITLEWGPGGVSDGDILTAVFQEETETEYTLRMMVSEGYIRAHATLYVKIGNNAEVAYTFASAEDMQNITVPEGSSVRLRVEWDDLFYPATFLGWLNDYTSQAESTSNPYTFTMLANKYITCNLRSDSN
jgi:hypothetical protein